MVDLQQSGEADATVVAWPNAALPWAAVRRAMLFLTAAIALVAGYFAAQGAWLVLPFAGLEALAVCIGFYLSARHAVTREVLRFDGPDLVIARGRRQLTEIGRLPRFWTRVALVRDPRGWYPSRLYLESHGRRLEIATALVDAERLQLAAWLRQRLAPAPAYHLAGSAPVARGLDPVPAYEYREDACLD
jgi:uncharacterized membrane protein